MLHCKGAPYRFSGYRELSVQTARYITFIQGLKHCFFQVRFRKKNHNPAGAGPSPTPSQQQSPRSASASGQPRQKKKSKKSGQLAGQPPPADSISSRLAEFPGPSGKYLFARQLLK